MGLERAKAMLGKDDLTGAERCCRAVLDRDPDNVGALFILGNCLFRREDYAGSIEAFSRADGMAPGNSSLLLNLGLALREGGRLEEAIETFGTLLRVAPESVKGHFNLGVAYHSKGQNDEACIEFCRTVELDPKHLEAWCRLGVIFHFCHMLPEAIQACRTALDAKPDAPQLWNILGNSYKYLGMAHEAIECYREARRLAPLKWEPFSNEFMTMLLSPDFTPREIYTAHCRWAALQADHFLALSPPHGNRPDPDRRLKVGYVSRDFVIHPVAFFIEPILASHDQERFRIFCYADVDKPDLVTERFEKLPVVWRRINGMSHDGVAERVRRDRIDILVDLAGHTMNHRLMVFARKPAPLQVTWLGYPATTGLAAMDYRITDAWADPPGMTESYHSEQLCRLPGPFICYRPPMNGPDVAPSPLAESGRCTFAVFNHFSKVTPRAAALWGKILSAVPGSRLVVKAQGFEWKSMQRHARAMLSAAGIDPGRLELIGMTSSVLEHLQRFSLVDISLDPFPYNGTTTTCESLWMGVPVVTIEGSSHVSRVGCSILNHLRLPQLIARNEEEYIRLAVELARNRERLVALRANLRKIMLDSPLLDAAFVTRTLEDAYREMWRRWCVHRENTGTASGGR